MVTRWQFPKIFSICAIILISFNSPAHSEGNVRLYTPYTNISVPPGESVDYSIDIINNGSEMKSINISVSGLPRGWNSTLKAGGYVIRQITILPGEKKNVTLNLEIPMKVNKGNFTFNVVAEGLDLLPLVVNVSEQGTFKTEFTCDQSNMQGNSKSNFTFNTKLVNQTGETQMYSLRDGAPRGWNIVFKPNYKQATAVEVEPNNTANISIEVKPTYTVEAGTYRIPVQAVNSSTSAELMLEVVITGSYEMELTTPTGLLSTNITGGKERRVELLVKNTGSSTLENVVFRASKPAEWDVVFEPDTLTRIAAGGSANIFATVKAYDKAIPGDYVANITAQTPEVSSSVSFRISVKTPLLWGWLGIFIIVATLAAIYFLFRKYGRR